MYQKKSQYTSTIALVILLASASVSPVWGVTTYGEITGEETWSGTVSLMGDVTVIENATLTIEPGTIVQFEPNIDVLASGKNVNRIELTINEGGALNAIGTEEKPIRFTPKKTSPEGGEWYGVVVSATSVNFEYCEFEYADVGLDMYSNSQIYGTVLNPIKNCTFYNNNTGMRLIISNKSQISNENISFEIIECIFTKCEYGIWNGSGGSSKSEIILRKCKIDSNADGIYNYGYIEILDSIVMNNDRGYDSSYGSSVDICDCNIYNNNIGLFILKTYRINISRCVFVDNEDHGIYLIGVDLIDFKDNVITGNGTSVDIVGNETININEGHNDIYSNSSYDLKNSGTKPIMANGNYWGQPTTDELKAGESNLTKIYDSRDNSSVGAVIILDYSETPYNEDLLVENTPTPAVAPTNTPAPTIAPTSIPTSIPTNPPEDLAFTVQSTGSISNGVVTVQLNVQYEGTLTAFGVSIDSAPLEWTFSQVTQGNPSIVPEAGSAAPLEFAWVAVPSSPSKFAIEFLLTDDPIDVQTVSGEVIYRREGNEQSVPFTIQIDPFGYHNADTDQNYEISQSELMRVIQFYNTGGYHCADTPTSTEDGFEPGLGDNHSRAAHHSDYNPQDWQINQSELLRLIQFYNTGGYHVDATGEDGFAQGKTVTSGKIVRNSLRDVYPNAANITAVRERTIDSSSAVITIDITHDGGITAFGLQETLPASWTFDSLLSGNPSISPAQGASGAMEFTWLVVPSSPITLSYRVNLNGGDSMAAIEGIVRYRTTGAEETIAISENITQYTSTPTPTPTTAPALPTPIPGEEQYVFVFDNADILVGDLTGTTDFDSLDNQNLTIHCTGDASEATDWHVYMRKGFGGYKYLGRTGSSSPILNWFAQASGLAADYRNGPDFNSVYRFRVARIDGQLTPDDFFTLPGSVGFNIEGGNELSLSAPDNPYLPEGVIAVYDDILGGENLAPSGQTGSDTDRSSWNALQIAWNMGLEASAVNTYHVKVSVDGGDYQFLGQTFTGDVNYYWWNAKQDFLTAEDFIAGPQDGHSYRFKVIALRFEGGNVSLTSGTLNYSITN